MPVAELLAMIGPHDPGAAGEEFRSGAEPDPCLERVGKRAGDVELTLGGWSHAVVPSITDGKILAWRVLFGQ